MALALFLGFLVLRLPFRAEFLVNWDAANFALGVRAFDLEHHQPHPPGYLGYVLLGRLLKPLAGDANGALTLISAVSGGASLAGFFLLARRFAAERFALAGTVLLGASPLVWYYSGVALTYALELALGVGLVWLAYEARARACPRHLAAATVLLVILGAVRQSGGLLMTPLWLYTVWAFPWRVQAGALAGLVAGNLSWLIPLVHLSGGVEPFFRVSAELAGLAVAPTSIFAMEAGGLGQNAVIVGVGLLMGGHVALGILAVGILQAPRAALSPFRRHAPFFALWLIPALATYLLLHTGQLGYVLVLLPVLFLSVATSMEGLLGREAEQTSPVSRPRWRLPALTAGCAIVGLALTSATGSMLYGVARSGEATADDDGLAGVLAGLPLFRTLAQENGDLLDGVRQFDVRSNDAYWRDLLGLIDELDPEATRILTTPERAGSFRALTYYASDHTVLGVGHDLSRDFGHLFTARDGTSDYSVSGLGQASSRVPLPEGVRFLVVPDHEVREALESGGVSADVSAAELGWEDMEVGAGHEVLVLEVPEGTELTAEGGLDPWADDGGGEAPALVLNTGPEPAAPVSDR